MASDLVSRMGDVLRAEPPVDGTLLRGWVMLAEWVTPEGERHFEQFGEPSSNSTQLKGYLHGGLYRMVTTGFDERRSAWVAATSETRKVGARCSSTVNVVVT